MDLQNMGSGLIWGIMCLVLGLIVLIVFLPLYNVFASMIDLGALTYIMIGAMILVLVLVVLTFGIFGRRNEVEVM